MDFNVEDILMEDDDILVVRKKAGMAVQHAGVGQMDMEHLLLNYLAGKGKVGRRIPYLAVIHRLDQPVEGVIVFAKNPGAAKILNAQMQKNEIHKEYLAVVDHAQTITRGRLVDYLLKNGRSNFSKVTTKGTPGGKLAELEYQILEQSETDGKALVRIILKTGRHHQIRVQMAHAGMPLYGDRKYNPQYKDGGNLALCAHRLSFRHPRTGKILRFQAVPENRVFAIFGEGLSDKIADEI
ncbi:MAG TPA: RluA family pseudouridine synthase [Candidatus Pelethocola excrementipullorum]|nr:RluA family pseudouridine synthase [Candidatus Pelethocola excrementipullorum]